MRPMARLMNSRRCSRSSTAQPLTSQTCGQYCPKNTQFCFLVNLIKLRAEVMGLTFGIRLTKLGLDLGLELGDAGSELLVRFASLRDGLGGIDKSGVVPTE